MPDTSRYFEIVNEFNHSGLPYNGTHDLLNFVREKYPNEVDYVSTIYEALAKGGNHED